MLNNCKIRDTIARYQWFDRTVNMHSRQQQSADIGDEQTVESDAYVSVSSMKTSLWSILQIIFHGSKQVTKNGSYLREISLMYSVTKINLFGNTNRSQTDKKWIFP